MTKRSDGGFADRQTMLCEQFGDGSIRRLFVSQLCDDISGRQQVLELLWTERCKFRDGLADGGWVEGIHKPEMVWIRTGKFVGGSVNAVMRQ